MSVSNGSVSSQQPMLPENDNHGSFINPAFMRDASSVSANDIAFPKLLENDEAVDEQTLMQVQVVNDDLLRKTTRSELASKNQCLTRRWQTALTISLVLLALAGAIGGLAYWITLPKVITEPFSLYGATCYMNSRSCDATRMLWCPAGTCICTGNYQWNVTIQNCTCGQYESWTGLKCQGYGYFGDPCNTIPCRPTLTCSQVINQTCTTGQDICECDNTTYLETAAGVNQGTCVARLPYNSPCLTKFDCQDWLGLSCTSVNMTGPTCLCDSTSYWNGSLCVGNALGWEPCSVPTIPCDTTRGLTCLMGICECDQYSYWDNITTLWCQEKKTYAVSCQFDFQCNTTVNLSCPSVSTGCNCYATSYAYICDCQSGNFWDGQRCAIQHSFNGTCPGQYACSSNLVCYLGHCICPGNQLWAVNGSLACGCAVGTSWNNVMNRCV